MTIYLLYRSFNECIGEIREDFFALAMAQHGVPFTYAKTTRGMKTPDFVLNEDDVRSSSMWEGKERAEPSSRGSTMMRRSSWHTGATSAPRREGGCHCIAWGFPRKARATGARRGPWRIGKRALLRAPRNCRAFTRVSLSFARAQTCCTPPPCEDAAAHF